MSNTHGTRQTSIDTYHRIEREGLLSERRWQVYDILFHNGPLTSSELFEIFKEKYKSPFRYNANVHSRLNELAKRGVAEEVGDKCCSVSGNRVILWDVTNRLPMKWEKPKKIKCKNCDGKGYIIEQQGRLF